ncbi:LMBR1 domain-containing protein 2 A [Fulvia fulva]|nr:LMBR1 domain-containing protein 2 A [Fulvia fulva]WPV08691.1 LMBR1 domain-containing protein 2 A [Fulvia fulva]WPV24050.1 LMBR1 domain-containing protein 2 A [Fulvia fulva]
MDGDLITAAASSVGSNIFAILSIVTIALLALLVIRHYLPLRSTPGYLLVPVFLALALPCSIILLVPIDLASAAGDEETRTRGVWLPERVNLVAWRITYWLTFMLTWFILPLLGEYCDSGYRETRSRVIYSLRANARYQLIVLGTAVAGLVYFIWENGLHVASIKGLVMALAYAWGLVLGLALMGHGLVALPRRLYRNANVSERLRQLQSQAPKFNDGLEEATDKLDELERTVVQLKRHKGGASSAQQEWIDELADTSTLPELRPGMTAAIQATNPSIPAVVTDRYLADLTRKLKRARHRKARFQDEWSNLCQQAQDTQTILDSALSKKLDFGRKQSGEGGILGKLVVLTPTMRYYLHASIIPYLRIGVAGILGVASILIVWSELVKSLAPSLSVIGLTVVHGNKVNFGGQLIAAAWLLYMDTTALYAISDVKVWGNRALVKRQTYAESATWYSLQVAKLTVPLSYNFITMMPPAVYKETMFFRFLGQLINLTPLGQGFSAFFPCFLVIPVLATLFNLYGKTKSWFGFGVLEDDSEDNPSGFGTGGWREGKALIDRELQSRGSGANLGLASRGASLDQERGTAGASAPPRRVAEDQRGREQYRDEGIREANRQFNAITNQEEDDQGDSARHFYQDFGERVRNTFDTVDQPEWIRNIGSACKAPKWMQNDSRDENGGSAPSKWFGGRAEDGRVRL